MLLTSPYVSSLFLAIVLTVKTFVSYVFPIVLNVGLLVVCSVLLVTNSTLTLFASYPVSCLVLLVRPTCPLHAPVASWATV